MILAETYMGEVINVRFTAGNGHWQSSLECPPWPDSEHRPKLNCRVRKIVGKGCFNTFFRIQRALYRL